MCLYIIVFTIYLSDTSDQWIFHTRAQPDEKCDEAFTMFWEGIQALKTAQPMAYPMVDEFFGEILNVNMSDPNELKPLICKITGTPFYFMYFLFINYNYSHRYS